MLRDLKKKKISTIKNIYTLYQNTSADFIQFWFHFLAIFFDHLLLLFATLGLQSDAGYHPPWGPPRPNHVFVGDGQQVPLLVWQLLSHLCNSLHTFCHVVVALSLLCQLGFLDKIRFSHSLYIYWSEKWEIPGRWVTVEDCYALEWP